MQYVGNYNDYCTCGEPVCGIDSYCDRFCKDCENCHDTDIKPCEHCGRCHISDIEHCEHCEECHGDDIKYCVHCHRCHYTRDKHWN